MNKLAFTCGVPKDVCTGSTATVSHGLTNKVFKVHGSSTEAFNCHARWLVSQGYEQIGSREFYKEGKPIRVLTKKSKFGGHLRFGKLKARHMPKKQTGGLIASV